MKILYGVQGTGNGHLSRARSMSRHLAAANMEVDYLFSGRDREKYFDMECFGDWQTRRGLTFSVSKGKVKPLATLAKVQPKLLLDDINGLNLDDYDLVISDYEPVTAWAARKQRRDCLGIGHQYAFHHKIPIRGDNFATRFIMNRFAPVSHSLGLHWYHFNAPILPPIVDPNESPEHVDQQTIIVYLPFEDPATVVRLLNNFSDYRFQYFGEFLAPTIEGNVYKNPISRDRFQQELAKSGGVICNAGFELASESINLGKKLLVKPLQGQMEQISNALALHQLGLGVAVNKLTKAAVQEWLKHFSAKRVRYPDVAKYIVDWLQQGDFANKQDLIRDLWQATDANGLTGFANYKAA